ncbi:MAG: thioredoxin family protein [Phycisphaerales bacterium]|nr:MAG: thioredoxin family protein [Phycisphaerales bacterium]
MLGTRLLKTVLALAVPLLIIGCNENAEPDPPPPATQVAHSKIFVKKSFDEAMAAADAEGKVLFVDVVTSWCVPCKEMDKSTWLDENLAEWFAEHAVAIKIDTGDDVQFRVDHGIKKWPTFLIFKDGEELARDTDGYKTADELITWLEDELKDIEKKG